MLMVDGTEHPLAEVSESGGRLVTTSVSQYTFKSRPRVTISFGCGQTVKTIATCLRVEGEEMVLQFFPTIPQTIILAEQRWLLTKYTKDQLQAARGS